VAAELTANPDWMEWLAKLDQSGARHLVVFHDGVVKDPPELAVIRQSRGQFQLEFSNEAGTVWRVR